MVKRSLFVLPLALGLLTMAGPARAQQGYVRGYSPYSDKNLPHGYLGVQGIGLAVAGQESGASGVGYLGAGGGVGLFAGGRLNPIASIEGTVDATFHDQDYLGAGGTTALDNLYLMSFGGAIRLNVPTNIMLEPYFRLGAGYSFLGATWNPGYDFGTIFAHGFNFVAGIGAELYAGPWFSLGGSINYRGYWFDEPRVSIESGLDRNTNYVSMIGFSLAATFHM